MLLAYWKIKIKKKAKERAQENENHLEDFSFPGH
jgi:hypothetical protein